MLLDAPDEVVPTDIHHHPQGLEEVCAVPALYRASSCTSTLSVVTLPGT